VAVRVSNRSWAAPATGCACRRIRSRPSNRCSAASCSTRRLGSGRRSRHRRGFLPQRSPPDIRRGCRPDRARSTLRCGHLSGYLESQGLLDQVGGLAYLGSLARDTPTAANIRAYADIVRERSVLRQLITAGNDRRQRARAGRPRGARDRRRRGARGVRDRGARLARQGRLRSGQERAAAMSSIASTSSITPTAR
jgi:hypothetical protein